MILDYADSRSRFTLSELTAYIRGREDISDSGILWHIKKLISQNRLSRLARGLYGHNIKKAFEPALTDEMRRLYDDIVKAFPLIDVVVYSGKDISMLQHHMSANNAIYLEVTKEAALAVFHYLIANKYKVFHKPSKALMTDYVDLNESLVIVKPLTTEAPVMRVDGIPVAMLEKILVDINTDSDFFYLQGIETSYIIENAKDLYNINVPKMLRYASRRGIRKHMQSLLNDIA